MNEKTRETISDPKKEKASSLKVYDPPMCCSTGVCGTDVNEKLVEFAGLLKKIEAHGIKVSRFNLSQQPRAFAENDDVRAALARMGQAGLPLVYIDDDLVISGRYPDSKELLDLLGINDSDIPADAGGKTIQGAGVISLTDSAGSAAGECCPGGGAADERDHGNRTPVHIFHRQGRRWENIHFLHARHNPGRPGEEGASAQLGSCVPFR